MTWIDKTLFAQDRTVNQAPQPGQEIAEGAPVDVIREWLERSDFINDVDAKDQLRSLLLSLAEGQPGNAKCQPT